MGITAADQALLNDLSQRYPRGTDNLEAQFRKATIDRQADEFLRSAKNAQQFREQRLFVPSTEELNYRAGIKPPTTATAPRPPEFRPYQPTTSYRPTSQTPSTYQPTSANGCRVYLEDRHLPHLKILVLVQRWQWQHRRLQQRRAPQQ